MNEYTEFDTAAEMQKALDRKKAAYGVPYAPLLETTVVNQDGIIEDAFKGNAIEISTCCGAQDRPTSIDGPSYEDVGYCPECGDHTEFITVCDECSESPCQCHTARSRADRDPVNSLLQLEEKVSFQPSTAELAVFLIFFFLCLGLSLHTVMKGDRAAMRGMALPRVESGVGNER